MALEMMMYFWLTAAICLMVVSAVAVAGVFHLRINRPTMGVIGILMAIPVVWFCLKAAREDQRLRAPGHAAMQSSGR